MPAKATRRMILLLHHGKTPNEALVRAVVAHGGPDAVSGLGKPYDEFMLKRLIERQAEPRKYGGGNIRLHYPRPPHHSSLTDSHVEIEFNLNPASPKHGLSNNRYVQLPLFDQQLYEWLWIGGGLLDPSDTLDVAFFLERARRMIPLFEPDFGCADTDVLVAKNLGENPRVRAWPVMLYGPEMVRGVGRGRLLKAPAWKVEELPYGGVWIQVAENPFMAERKELRALSDYLGLEV